jgi:hypothetical protein
MRLSTVSLAVGAGLAVAVPARGDSLTDTLSVRALGQGEAVRASASGAAATSSNPAGAALSRDYIIEGTYGFRGVDDSTVAGAAVCDPQTTKVAVCAYYSYFASEPEGGKRTLHDFGSVTALPLGERFILGLTGRYVDYEEEGSFAEPEDEDGSVDGGFRFDAGLIVRLTDYLDIAGVGYNLIGADGDQYPRAVGAGVAFTLGQNFMLSGDGVWNLQVDDDESTGRYGAGAEFIISAAEGQQGFPLRAGYVYDVNSETQYVTGGLGFATPKVRLEAGLRQQVAGEGDETMFQIGLKIYNP